jgi:hypothetical protein
MNKISFSTFSSNLEDLLAGVTSEEGLRKDLKTWLALTFFHHSPRVALNAVFDDKLPMPPGVDDLISLDEWETFVSPFQGDGWNKFAVYVQILPVLKKSDSVLQNGGTPKDVLEVVDRFLKKEVTAKTLLLLEDAGVATLVDVPGYRMDVVLSPEAVLNREGLRSGVADTRDFWSLVETGNKYGFVIETSGSRSTLSVIGKTGLIDGIDRNLSPTQPARNPLGVNSEGSPALQEILASLRAEILSQWKKNVLALIKEKGEYGSQAKAFSVRLAAGKPLSVVVKLPPPSKHRDSLCDRFLTALTVSLPQLGTTMFRDYFLGQCSVDVSDYVDEPLQLLSKETLRAWEGEDGRSKLNMAGIVWDIYTKMLENSYLGSLKEWGQRVLEKLGGREKQGELLFDLRPWQDSEGRPDAELCSDVREIDGQADSRAMDAVLGLFLLKSLESMSPPKWYRIDVKRFNAEIRRQSR